MSEKTKIKDFLIYYIPQRVIIFPIYQYIPILADTIIKDLEDWDLIKEGKLISYKEKYFKFFLEKELDKIISTNIILFKDLKVKIYNIGKDIELPEYYSQYFQYPNNFSNIVNNTINKKTKYFRKIKEDSLFSTTEGFYKNIKVGVPNGEDLEFFHNIL
jgi:hypothetical protein